MGERFNTCDLREKDVINLCDGTNLGNPCEFEFDMCDGRITAMIVPRPCGFLGLSHSRDIVIPWSKIECIGEDAILVKLTLAECQPCGEEKKRKKRF